jgi:hypothetical protein
MTSSATKQSSASCVAPGLLRFARNDVPKIWAHVPAVRCTRGFIEAALNRGRGRPLKKRAQGRPGARCTRDLVCKAAQKNAHEHTGSAEAVRPSLRNGFNGFLRALPGDEFVLSPSGEMSRSNRIRPTGSPLAPATGVRTTRLRRPLHAPSSAFRWNCSRAKARPANQFRAGALKRPPHPAPRIVTIASRPSCGAG